MLHRECWSDGMHTAHQVLPGQGQISQVCNSQKDSVHGLEFHPVNHLHMLH